MADNTKIEWTEATWSPITGCSIVSAGCTNCYAMGLAGTRLKDHPSRTGLTKCVNGNHVWTGETRFNEQWLDQPLRWKRPRKIFVCAHSDLFHESVPFEWIDKIFVIMALAPQHTFQVLTKRPERMHEYLSTRSGIIAGKIFAARKDKTGAIPLAHIPLGKPWWPLANVWLGVSAENQTAANERVPILLDTPAAVRWLSAEPLLSAINLNTLVSNYDANKWLQWRNALKGTAFHTRVDKWVATNKLDWVVIGGESGVGARPMHPDWAQNIINDCLAAKVPVLFKQWGNWVVAIDRDKQDPNWVNDYKANDPNYRILNLAGGHGFHGERVCLMRRVPKKEAGRAIGHIIFDQYPN